MFGGECEGTSALVCTGSSLRGATLDPRTFSFRRLLCIRPPHSPPRNTTCAEDGEISWLEGLSGGGSAEEGWLLAKANRCLAGADVGVHLQHISKNKYLPVASPKHPHPLFFAFLNFASISLLRQMCVGGLKITFLNGSNAVVLYWSHFNH